MKVHDRDDVDAFRLDAIQQTEGKLRNEKAPEPPAKRWARGWSLEEAFVSVLNRSDEVEPEPFRLSLVEVGCRNERPVLRNETRFVSPKRGAGLLDYLLGGDPGDLPGLELPQPSLGLLKPELLSIRSYLFIETADELLREAGALPAGEFQGLRFEFAR